MDTQPLDENMYILKDKGIAFEIDNQRELIYFYSYFRTVQDINKESKTILKSINSLLAQELESYFKIEMRHYGVQTDENETREITQEETEEIGEKRFAKYLFMFMGFITASLLLYGYIEPSQEATRALGWLSLFSVLFVLVLVSVKERVKKDAIYAKLKNNIVTKPLPDKDEQLDILEAKIDKLLKEKNDAKYK